MVEAVLVIGVACGALAGIGRGFAAMIREYCQGRPALVRAERGDNEPDARKTTVSDLLKPRDR